MALALARTSRLSRSAQIRYLFCRNFASSAPAHKRRHSVSDKLARELDDLFSAPADEDDLFAVSSGTQSSSTSDRATSAFNRPLAQTKQRSAKKSPFEHFDEQFAFVMNRLGPKATERHPLVRHSAIKRLLYHAQGPEHLDRVVEVLVYWRNDGKVVDLRTTRELIDRCIAWNPPLLNTLFADKPKYGLTIPALLDARQILHRLVFHRPHPIAQSPDPDVKKAANAEALRNVATFAALMSAHGLKRATDDLVCCALLAQACARNLNFAPIPPKTGESSEEGDTAQAGAEVDTPAKRAELGDASARGLLSLSSSLASLLSKYSSDNSVHKLPSPEYVAQLAVAYRKIPHEMYKGVYEGRETYVRRIRDPIVFEKRASGGIQTGLLERSWVVHATRDVLRALKAIGNVDKTRLSMLGKVLENTLSKEEAEKEPGIRPDDVYGPCF